MEVGAVPQEQHTTKQLETPQRCMLQLLSRNTQLKAPSTSRIPGPELRAQLNLQLVPQLSPRPQRGP
eukprot:9214974-Alexandrium_andersonii.AAC.1